MSISPLPTSHSTMALMAANHTAPARPAADPGTDNAGRGGDEEFVSKLSAASSSKSADDATISEQDGSESTRTHRKAAKAPEEDSDRRALLAQAWHTTMTGMPPANSAGALALPAALLAHGELALGTGAAGDMDADAPPVAVVGIGVVTEAGSPGPMAGMATGPILNPATLSLGTQRGAGPAGLPTGGAPATDAAPAAPTTGAFGLQTLTVVPTAGEARPAVEAAITANADSAAAAAAFAGEDVTFGVDLAAATAARPDGGVVDTGGGGSPKTGIAGLLEAGLASLTGAGSTGARAGGAGADGAANAAPGGVRSAPAVGQGGFGLDAIGGTPAAIRADGTAAVSPVGATQRQLSPAELAAVQETAAQNAAAQNAAARATAVQLGQFLQPAESDAIAGVAAAIPAAPTGPFSLPTTPEGLPGYVPAVAGADAGTTGDTGTGGGTAQRGEESFADALAATTGTTAPDSTTFTPLLTPDVSTTPSIDPSGVAGADPTSQPPAAAQVADQIIPLRAQGDGVHRIAMELRPDDLGTIGVVAEIRNGQVHLHFSGANELTRETLRAALPELRQQLEDAGFAGAGFDFGDGSPPGQNERRQFGATDQGTGNRAGRDGQAANQGGETGRQTGQRPPGFVEPVPAPPAGTGRHALDLQA